MKWSQKGDKKDDFNYAGLEPSRITMDIRDNVHSVGCCLSNQHNLNKLQST